MGKAFIMRGISGSGKSTVARQIAADEPKAVIVSADHFFENEDGGYDFDPSKLSEAHGACFRRFVEALQAGAPMVVCAHTHTMAREASPYVLAAPAYGYEAEVVEVHCDPKVAAARNSHGTPAHVVERMADRMARESLPPWWNVTKVA